MMKKRWLLNLALAAVIVALALLVKYQPGAPQDAAAPGPPLTQLDAAQISHIRLQRPGQETIVLARHDSDWQLLQPIKARADRFRVDGLLQLAGARIETKLASADLAPYGLDKPPATVWLNDTEIRLGNKHSLNDLQYAWVNNEAVLIPAASTRGTATKATDFLSTALLEKNRKPVAFVLPKFKLELQDGTWKRQPEIKELSSDRINAFVEEWRHARALSVSRHGAQAAKHKIIITYIEQGGNESGAPPAPTKTAPTPATAPPAKRESLEIGIVSYTPDFILYRADEGLDYHFPKETGERLLDLKPE